MLQPLPARVDLCGKGLCPRNLTEPDEKWVESKRTTSIIRRRILARIVDRQDLYEVEANGLTPPAQFNQVYKLACATTLVAPEGKYGHHDAGEEGGKGWKLHRRLCLNL
jgi:hypothetical protein